MFVIKFLEQIYNIIEALLQKFVENCFLYRSLYPYLLEQGWTKINSDSPPINKYLPFEILKLVINYW